MAEVELMAEVAAGEMGKNTSPPEALESIHDASGPVRDSNPGQSTSDDAAADSDNPDASTSRQPSRSHSGRSSRRSSRSNSPQKRKVGMEGLLVFLDEGYELFEVGNGGEVRKLDAVPDSKTLRRHKRNFILRRKTTHQKADEATRLFNGGQGVDPNVDRFDYEKRYPPDEPGQEKAPGARIWRVYMDEAGQFDLDMVENMRDTVDVILVFAGLFSAIVTTLVALTATALQLDHPKVTNLLLMELIALQRASLTGGSIDQIIPSPLNAESASNSTAERTDYWINGLWFTSLAFSLSTALIAVLVKQWIQAYVAPSFQGTPRAQAEVRHFRYRGIETWHVPLIIGLLPTLLHLSLFLFFSGLVVFLFTLDVTIASIVTAITSVACIAYLVTNFLPVSYPGCPYQTPISHYAFFILHTCKTLYTSFWAQTSIEFDRRWRLFITFLLLPLGLAIRAPWYIFRRPSATLWEFIIQPLKSVNYFIYIPARRQFKPKSVRDMESQAIATEGGELHSQMLGWLVQTSATNPSAKSAIVSCLSDDPIDFAHLQPPLIPRADWNRLLQRMISFHVMSSDATLDHARLAFIFSRIGESNLQLNKQIGDDLISVHKYSKAHGLSSINEEAYNLSSRVEWGLASYSSGPMFLERFCLHVLYTSARTLLDHGSLPNNNLQLLYPAIRNLQSSFVRSTPEGMHKLKRWFPPPTLADSLTFNGGTIAQLQPFLDAGTFLLQFKGLGFINAFREAKSLVFWRIVYDRHSNDLSQDLVKAFHRMVQAYIRSAMIPLIRKESQVHLDHTMEHLQTIFLWLAASPVDETVPMYMFVVADKYPWNPAWQEVQDTLPGLLSLMSTQAKLLGMVLLSHLTGVLQEARAKRPQPPPRGAVLSLPIGGLPAVRTAVRRTPDNAADASTVAPLPLPDFHDNAQNTDSEPTAVTFNPVPSPRDPPNTIDITDDTIPPVGDSSSAIPDIDPPLSGSSNAVSQAASGSPSTTTNNSTVWARARHRLNFVRHAKTSSGSGHNV